EGRLDRTTVGTNGWLPGLHCVSDSHCEKALDPYSIRLLPKGHKLRQRDGGHQRNAVSIGRELSCHIAQASGWIGPSAPRVLERTNNLGSVILAYEVHWQAVMLASKGAAPQGGNWPRKGTQSHPQWMQASLRNGAARSA